MKKSLLSLVMTLTLCAPTMASTSVNDFENSAPNIPAQLAAEKTGCPTLRRQDLVSLAQSNEVTLEGQFWTTVQGSEDNAKILAKLIESETPLAMDEVFHCNKAVKEMVGDKAHCTYELCLNAHPAFEEPHYKVTITTK
jgi:hypothetical protein